jgi:hypothetical protein
MTPEQFTAIVVAITGLIAAVGAVFVQLRQTHSLLNGRMTQLIEQTKIAATASGEMAGRDFEQSKTAAAPTAETQNG